MKYYMLRLYTQTDENGAITDKTATYVHTDYTAAMKQYYKMLATDIDDDAKPTCLCMVVDEQGVVRAAQRFNHTTTQEATDE